MQLLGIDIGGSGIKGAPVDLESGELAAPRYRIPTPDSARPGPVAKVVGEVARHFEWSGPIGIGFPAIVRHGVTWTAANVHQKWIGADAASLFEQATGCPVTVVNDADAAGIAEMTFGAGQGRPGTVMVVTIGTGLGTALFTQGVLVPNCEFGHLNIRGKDAETRASDAARQRESLSWKRWAGRFDEVLRAYEFFLSPDLFILGGGVSKKFDRFSPYLTVQAEVVPAALLNEAGIVGAALATRALAAEG